MDQPDLEKLLEQYQKELAIDANIDELSLKDKSMAVPSIKHKWVGRLMQHKFQYKKLVDAKKKALKNITGGTPVRLTKEAQEHIALTTNPELAKVQESIEQLELVIEYLEKVEKLLSTLTWDCKNVVEIQRQETT